MDEQYGGAIGLPSTSDLKALVKQEVQKIPAVQQAVAAGEGVQQLIPMVTEAPDTIKASVEAAVDAKLAEAGVGSAAATGYDEEYPADESNQNYATEYEGGGEMFDDTFNDLNYEEGNINEYDENNYNGDGGGEEEEQEGVNEEEYTGEGGGEEVMYEGYGGEGMEYGVQAGGDVEEPAMEGVQVYQNQSGGYFIEQPVEFNPQTGGFYIIQSIADYFRAQQGGSEEFEDPTAEELAAAQEGAGVRRRAYRYTHKISGQGIRQMAKRSSRRSSRRAGTRKNRRNARRGTRRNGRRNNGNGNGM